MLLRVTVFHIHILKYNGQVGEVIPCRDFNFANLDRRAQALIGFLYKCLNDAVFEDKHRSNQGDGDDQYGTKEV